jgi:uncharacterized FlaG/YvyC family protein
MADKLQVERQERQSGNNAVLQGTQAICN